MRNEKADHCKILIESLRRQHFKFLIKKIEKRATKLFLACIRAPFIRAKLDRDRKKEKNERDIKCAKERKE